jgi:hypothetical protein
VVITAADVHGATSMCLRRRIGIQSNSREGYMLMFAELTAL